MVAGARWQVPAHKFVAVAEHVTIGRWSKLVEEPTECLLSRAGQEPGEIVQVTAVGGERVGTSPFEERRQQVLDGRRRGAVWVSTVVTRHLLTGATSCQCVTYT